jgi:hypothetical protein
MSSWRIGRRALAAHVSTCKEGCLSCVVLWEKGGSDQVRHPAELYRQFAEATAGESATRCQLTMGIMMQNTGVSFTKLEKTAVTTHMRTCSDRRG